jgi:hypothetical protein
MPKKSKSSPKLPKKRTPNQAVNKATKERKRQGQKIRAEYDLLNDPESRSREDVN